MQKIRRRISKISKITLFDIKKGIAKKQWYIPNTAYKEEGDKIEKEIGIRPIFIYSVSSRKYKWVKN